MRIGILQCVLAALLGSIAYAHESSAQSILSRDMTLSFTNVSLKEALGQIQEKTEIKFVYSTRISLKEKINLHVEKQKLSKVLDILLEPRGISYRVYNEQIVLAPSKKMSEIFLPEIQERIRMAANPADIVVKGKVTSADNKEVLPGVSIVVKGTQQGTTTNGDGEYEIRVPNAQSTLIFSFVGYLAKEEIVGSQSVINISLGADTKSLQEVVVIGYGTVKKSDLSAAVATVPDMDKIKNRPVLDVGNMIQGKVPGVTSVGNGGHPDQNA